MSSIPFPVSTGTSRATDAQTLSQIRDILTHPMTRKKVEAAWKKFLEVEWTSPVSPLGCSYKTFSRSCRDFQQEAKQLIKQAEKTLVPKGIRSSGQIHFKKLSDEEFRASPPSGVSLLSRSLSSNSCISSLSI